MADPFDSEQYEKYKQQINDKLDGGAPQGALSWMIKYGREEGLKKLNEAIESTRAGNVAETAPKRDPEQAALYQKGLKASQDYFKNLKNYSDTLYNDQAQRTRQDVDKGIKKVKNDYNSRGLLNSGVATQSQLDVGNEGGAQLADYRGQLNRGLLDTAQNMESGVFDMASGLSTGGLNTAGSYINRLTSDIQKQNQDTQMNTDLLGSVGSGVGKAAGLGIGQLVRKK